MHDLTKRFLEPKNLTDFEYQILYEVPKLSPEKVSIVELTKRVLLKFASKGKKKRDVHLTLVKFQQKGVILVLNEQVASGYALMCLTPVGIALFDKHIPGVRITQRTISKRKHSRLFK